LLTILCRKHDYLTAGLFGKAMPQDKLCDAPIQKGTFLRDEKPQPVISSNLFPELVQMTIINSAGLEESNRTGEFCPVEGSIQSLKLYQHAVRFKVT